jgi:hypothetical protein
VVTALVDEAPVADADGGHVTLRVGLGQCPRRVDHRHGIPHPHVRHPRPDDHVIGRSHEHSGRREHLATERLSEPGSGVASCLEPPDGVPQGIGARAEALAEPRSVSRQTGDALGHTASRAGEPSYMSSMR